MNRYSSRQHAECPCCGWQGWRFRILDVGHWIVPDVECPECGAHDRHRMLHLFMSRAFPEPTLPKLLLHIAPERYLVNLLKPHERIKIVYTDIERAALIHAQGPCFLSDLQKLSIPDDTFDWVFCIHVLEHVLNDIAALNELARILKPSGIAAIMVPFAPLPHTRDWGAPNPIIFNHVKEYSLNDFAQRLSMFSVETVEPKAVATHEELSRYGIAEDDILYICHKQHPSCYSISTNNPSLTPQ